MTRDTTEFEDEDWLVLGDRGCWCAKTRIRRFGWQHGVRSTNQVDDQAQMAEHLGQESGGFLQRLTMIVCEAEASQGQG